MADDYRFSYSISPPTSAEPSSSSPASSTNEDASLYAFTGCDLIDQGDDTTLVINRDNGCEFLVQSPVATALTYCTTFQTLDQHAHMLANTLPPLQGQAANVLAVLNTVRDSGVMLHAKDVVDRLTTASATPTQLAPTRAFIITCDRPAAVERLLESTLRAGNLLNHDALFLIDDSRDPANAAQNRELVSQFTRNSAKPMLYVGADAQQAMITTLMEATPDSTSSIGFLLDHTQWGQQPTFGLARNLCLLLSVGYRAIVMDDDIVCEGVRSPLKRPGLAFGSGNTRQASFYGNEKQMLASQIEKIQDPLGEQSRCLGLTLPEAILKVQHNPITEAALQGANAAFLASLTEKSPVLISQCGTLGDPGTADSHWIVNLDLESQARLLDSPGGLSEALEKRHSWLGYAQPTICKTAVMSQLTGLDNSHLLPPYFPAFRGEDGLFAIMVAFLYPDSAVFNSDWAIVHLPLENRSDRGLRAPFPTPASLALLARVVGEQIDTASKETPEALLQSLSEIFEQLGAMESADLLNLAKQTLAAQWMQQAQVLTRQQTVAPQLHSKNWELYLQRGAQELDEALEQLSDSSSFPLAEAQTSATSPTAELVELAKAASSRYAQAIADWSAIREVASGVTDKLIATGSFDA